MDLATLGIEIKDGKAVLTVKELGEAAEKTAKQTDQLETAVKRANDTLSGSEKAAGRAKQEVGAWGALQQMAARHTGEHSLGIGRLERALEEFAAHAVGANRIAGLFATTLAKFAIGSVETIGILAGVAAIAAIYEHLTSAAREAAKKNDELIESLKKANHLASLGPGGETIDQLNAAAESLGKLRVELETYQRAQARGNNPGQLNGNFLGGGGLAAQANTDATTIQGLQDDIVRGEARVNAILQKSAEDRDHTYVDDLANLIRTNHATAQERSNALALLKSYDDTLKHISPLNTAGRSTTAGMADALREALFPKKDAADAIRDAKEYAAALAEATKATNNLQLARDKGSKAIEDERTNADALVKAAREGEVAYQAQADAIEVQNTLAQNGIYWFDARYDAAKRSLEIAVQERHETEAINKAREDAATKAKEAAQRAAEEAERPFKNMIRELQSEFVRFFDDIFTKGIKSFGDLVSAVRDMFLKMIAEILAASLMKKLAGVLGAMIGVTAAAGSQTAGSGGMLSGLGAQMAGQAAMGGLAGGAVGYGIGRLAGNAGGGGFLGAAGGAGVGFMLGGPIGAFAGGLTGLIGGLIGGAQAAREAAAAMRQMQKDYTAALMAFKHDDLGTALAQNAAQAEALRKTADALYGPLDRLLKMVGKNLGILDQNVGDINAQEAKNAAMIKRQQQYDLEDLDIRNLRATGHGDEADRKAFEEKQQREMQAAIDANRDQTYLNTLATTQNNELIAFLNGTLQDAIRNGPNGFRVDPYLYNFQTPRGPAGYPTDGGVNPPGPNPTGGLTPPGGSRNAPGNSVTLVFNEGAILVDGSKSADEVVTVLIDRLDQVAAAKNGAGSSRIPALDLLKRRR